MDEQLRNLERLWASGGPEELNRLLKMLLRIRSLKDWEIHAETGGLANKYIQLLRDYSSDENLQYSEFFINVYEDFTAQSTIKVLHLEDITRTRHWLRNIYTTYPIFYRGKTVYDVSVGLNVDDPAAQIIIENSTEPCFRQYANEIIDYARSKGITDNYFSPDMLRYLTPINKWGRRDHYVGFKIIESYELDSPEYEIEEVNSNIAHWVNAYQQTREYGGPQGGGWYYTAYDPLASIYIGSQPAVCRMNGEESALFSVQSDHTIISDEEEPAPQIMHDCVEFLAHQFDHINQGNISSVLGGSILGIRIETHPAVFRPYRQPYYN